MNAKITQQVELAFWDLIIQALSESKLVRYLVWNFYHLFKGKDRRKTWVNNPCNGNCRLSGWEFHRSVGICCHLPGLK